MAITYKLPKLDVDAANYIVTPLAADTALAQGVLTLKDEDGNVAQSFKISDVTGWEATAYSAGVANVVDVDFTASIIVLNNQYSLTIDAPYVTNFFGGGRETNAVYTTRTYTVGVDATPTATELADLFAARIAADTNAFFSASATTGVLTVTADSAEAGALIISSTASGTTFTDDTAWTAPSGTVAEFEQEVGVAAPGAGYEKFVIEYRKPIRHNAVKGLRAIKNEKIVYYIDKDDAGSAAAVTLVESILDGTYATTADYLGAPNF